MFSHYIPDFLRPCYESGADPRCWNARLRLLPLSDLTDPAWCCPFKEVKPASRLQPGRPQAGILSGIATKLAALTPCAGSVSSGMPILWSGLCTGSAVASSHDPTRLAGNHVTASVRVTSRTVPPLWSLTFRATTRSLYCFCTSLEIFARALTASRAAASTSANFVPNWSHPFNSPSVKSKK